MSRLMKVEYIARHVRSVATVAMSTIWLIFVSSCSGGGHVSLRPAVHSEYSRPALDGRITLTPNLLGGTAGWCMTLFDHGRKRGGRSSGGGCEEVPVTSAGPVFARTCTTNNSMTTVYVLTRGDVAAVRVDGGNAVPTTGEADLAAGLRAAVVEVLGTDLGLSFRQRLAHWRHLCSVVLPLNRLGHPIRGMGGRGKPLTVSLPSKRWDRPARTPHGACAVWADRLPGETVVLEGSVANEIRSIRGLIGKAFLSCADTTYLYRKEHDLTGAVLLDAFRPGAVPSPLVGMKPLRGHPGIFKAPGSNGFIVTRRIPGAWLAVEETDEVGLSVPMELLEHLRATIRL